MGMIPNLSRGSGPAARLAGACLRFEDREALHEVDLTIPSGAVTAVIGPNGSGKSSLLGLLSGLVRATSGTVEVLGAPAGRAGSRVAHVLQSTRIEESVPITVAEVVRMGAYARRGLVRRLGRDDRERVRAAMERLEIMDLAGRQLSELSGGQRQRVHVAQGLAQGADLLLLDEPISGLDVVSQRIIADVILDERDAGRTVVLTTHDVGTAGHADMVVLLATRVIAAGPPGEVLTQHHLAHAYGEHAHVLADGTVVLDEPHHHARIDVSAANDLAQLHPEG
jgi:ABC-type Mn2+/Zn2+ transport system ATPase subunit